MISPIHRRVIWPLKRDSMDIILGFTKALYHGQTDEPVIVIINLFWSHAVFFFDSCHFSATNPHVIFLRRFIQIVAAGLEMTWSNASHITFILQLLSVLLDAIRVTARLNALAELFRITSIYTWGRIPLGMRFLLSPTSLSTLLLPSGNNTSFQIDLGYNPLSPANLYFLN